MPLSVSNFINQNECLMYHFNSYTPINLVLVFIIKILFTNHSFCQNSIFQLNCTDPNFTNELYGEIVLLNESTIACECSEFVFEIKTFNATHSEFDFGDGNHFIINENPSVEDTTFATVTHTYCNTGSFTPKLIIQNNGCSGEVEVDFEILIDKIFPKMEMVITNPACEFLEVIFIDESQSELFGHAGINSRNWDFGDGLTSTATLHYHLYVSPGIHPVSFIAQTTSGCIAEIDTHFVVYGSPEFEISLSKETVCLNEEITFSYDLAMNENAGINSWNWSFNDNYSESNPNFNRSFDNPGSYEVELELTNTSGCSSVSSVEFEVQESFTLEVSNDTIICNGDSIELHASGADMYYWYSDAAIEGEQLPNPKVFNQQDATYFVVGSNQHGCEVVDSVFVKSSNVFADFDVNMNCIDLSLNISNHSSSNNNDISYEWAFQNLESNNSINSQEINPNFNYDVNGGNYSINLLAYDETGCEDHATYTISIESPQDLDFSYIGSCMGSTTEFNSSLILNEGEYLTNVVWTINGNQYTSSSLNTSFTFNNAGNHEVCLEVTTNQTCPLNPLQHCETIEIFSTPNAVISYNNLLCENEVITFENTSISNSNITESVWTINNESSSLKNDLALISIQRTFEISGTNNITLTVTDENGCEDTAYETIFINETPNASFSYEYDCVNQLVNFSCDVNNSSYSYAWYNETELIQSNSSSFDYDIKTSESFQAQLIVGNGVCFDTTSQLIELMPNQQIDIEISNELICKGDTVNLSVLNPINGNITWQINENGMIQEYFGEEIEVVLEYNALIKTYYNNTSFCIDTLSTTLEINEKPTAHFDFISNCIQENIDLSIDTTLNNATQYFWTINEDIQMEGSHISFTPNSDNDSVSVELYSINALGCSSTFSKNINIINQPEIEFNRSQFNTCSGGYVELSLNNNDLITFSNIDSLSWLPNKNIYLDIDKNSLILYPETNTIYEFQAFNNNGECASNVSEIMVSIIQEPAIEINTAQLGSKFDISIDVFPYNVATDNLTWTDPTNTLFPLFGGNVTATPQQNTTYDLTLTYQIDESICTLDTTVSVKLDKFLLAPNVFSPNRDGKNDLFTLTSKGYDYIKNIAIFDRWGKIIYEGNNLMFVDGKMEKGWDGNSQKGEPVNSSVYVYMYEAVCNNGEITKGSGNITLVK